MMKQISPFDGAPKTKVFTDKDGNKLTEWT